MSKMSIFPCRPHRHTNEITILVHVTLNNEPESNILANDGQVATLCFLQYHLQQAPLRFHSSLHWSLLLVEEPTHEQQIYCFGGSCLLVESLAVLLRLLRTQQVRNNAHAGK